MIPCAASMTDFIPEAQTLLTVVVTVPTGRPAKMDAWWVDGFRGVDIEGKVNFFDRAGPGFL